MTSVPNVRAKREIELFRVRSPKSGALQREPIDHRAPGRGFGDGPVTEEQADEPADQEEPMILHEAADPDDELGDGGERFVAQHVVEDRLELRHDEDHEEGHDDHGKGKHDDRINHRRLDLVFDLLRLFLELRETGENKFQHTAELAGFHHVDEELVKNSRMLRQALGESAAALHGIGELVDRVLEQNVALLFGEDVEPAQKRQAGIDQGRELPGEDHQDLGLDRFLRENNDPFFRLRRA